MYPKSITTIPHDNCKKKIFILTRIINSGVLKENSFGLRGFRVLDFQKVFR